MSLANTVDPSCDVLKINKSEFDAIFKPKSVAVVGASDRPGAVSKTILENLFKTSFGGIIYPVNPRRDSVCGIRAYHNVKDLPEVPDLVIVVIPAKFVPALVKDCADIGVPGMIIISAGFKEMGAPGIALEKEIMANKGNMRIIGPNVLGVMSPYNGLNASFAASMANTGGIAFFSQSGALCTSVLDWSYQNDIGFSAFVSIGSMLDIDWADLIEYFGNDEKTRAIVIYMEGLGDRPQAFFNAARQVSLNKPIILIKAGRTDAGSAAAASHTGSLTGSDEALDALCERSGILRVNDIEDLFLMADVLEKQPRPSSKNLTIVTNAGGPGVLSTDALISGGGQLTPLPRDSTVFDELNAFLPEAWSRGNPIDILGDAPALTYAKTLEIAAKDEEAGGLLVILTPQSVTDPTATAEALAEYADRFRSTGKPVLASWMGGVAVEKGRDILRKAGIPSFSYPDTACKAFNYMWKYSENLKSLYNIPKGSAGQDVIVENAKENARELLQIAIDEKRDTLTEAESKRVLHAYDIPVAMTHVCLTREDAMKAGDQCQYPVVVKLHSETITHKSDVGGVKLNIMSAEEIGAAWDDMESRIPRPGFLGVAVQPMIDAKDTWEVIVGSNTDPLYGPILVFGSGGTTVEIFKDTTLTLPPITRHFASKMIDRVKIGEALTKGFRGIPPADTKSLEDLIVKISYMISDLNEIAGMDLNPILVGPKGAVAVDARIILNKDYVEGKITREELPKSIIAAYPSYLTQEINGMTFRSVSPDDKTLLEEFAVELRSKNEKFCTLVAGLTEETLAARISQIARIDYVSEMAVVAEKDGKIAGLARLSKVSGNAQEFSIIVDDSFRRQNVAINLLNSLKKFVEVSKPTGFEMIGFVNETNVGGINLVKKAGFTLEKEVENVMKATWTC